MSRSKCCKNCKHWKLYRDCNNRMWMECNMIGSIDYGEELKSDDCAVLTVVSDDTGFMQSVRTGPNFGCTKFERRT